MKTIAHVICAVVLTSTLTAHGQTHDAGTTYEVEIVRNDGRVTTGGCMTFHQSGRFTMSDEALTMLWAPREHYPSQFMAVTAPGERTVVPYHFGVHGTLHPDKTLTGRGIDQTGNTFVFRGQAGDDCGGDLSERAASNPIQAITDPTSPRKELNPILDPCSFPDGSQMPCDPIPDPLRAIDTTPRELVLVPDPCWFADGSQVPCDPSLDPLRADAESVTTSTLAGRSFRLTLGTSDRRVLEYCWTFGENQEIKTDHSKVLRWSPLSSANDVARFQSVGAGANGRGMAYHGALVGDELLEVVGIEARDGKSVVTYGYGLQVSGCR